MKRSDFMKYKGKTQLCYELNILGSIGPSGNIPDQDYSPGDAWLISPEKGSGEFGCFLIFFDGTQFRLPTKSSACSGTDRSGKVSYIVESELSAMFLTNRTA